jgi:hypothetical protein
MDDEPNVSVETETPDECKYCNMSVEELTALVPWKDEKSQFQALFDSEHGKLLLNGEEHNVLLHLCCGGWEPDCADWKKICKVLGESQCSCSSSYTASNCGQS